MRGRLLREMGRVARLGVVINDLDRSRIGWLGAWLIGHLLTRNRLTRHDAPLSVRRAYRPTEVVAIAARRPGLIPVRTVRAPSGSATRSRRSSTAGPASRPTRRCARSARSRRPVTTPRVGSTSRSSGGGPAGAVLAARLAGAGREVVVLERAPRVAMAGGRRVRVARGGGGAARDRAGRADGASGGPARSRRCASRRRLARRSGLTYGADAAAERRSGSIGRALDPALLELARARGADVRSGATVADVDLRRGELAVRDPTGGTATRAGLGHRRGRRPPVGRGARGRCRPEDASSDRGSG